MFHATNASLGHQARRIRDIGLAPGAWRYRDPRSDHRRAGLVTSTPKRPAASRAVSNGGS